MKLFESWDAFPCVEEKDTTVEIALNVAEELHQMVDAGYPIEDIELFICKSMYLYHKSFTVLKTLELAIRLYNPCLMKNEIIAYYHRCIVSHVRKLLDMQKFTI